MHCLVSNNKVIRGPEVLPARWKNIKTGIVEPLSTLTPIQLIARNWFVYIPSTIVLRDPYDTINNRDMVIANNTVTEVITLSPLVLAEVIDEKSDIIYSYAENWLNGTVTWNGHVFNATLSDRQNIIGMSTAISNNVPLPPNFTWNASNGSSVPMTKADIIGFGNSILVWVSTTHVVMNTHVKNISSLTTPDAVINYDHTLGWPI